MGLTTVPTTPELWLSEKSTSTFSSVYADWEGMMQTWESAKYLLWPRGRPEGQGLSALSLGSPGEWTLSTSDPDTPRFAIMWVTRFYNRSTRGRGKAKEVMTADTDSSLAWEHLRFFPLLGLSTLSQWFQVIGQVEGKPKEGNTQLGNRAMETAEPKKWTLGNGLSPTFPHISTWPALTHSPGRVQRQEPGMSGLHCLWDGQMP